MGIPYDPSIDIWSIGCTLYELYTGKILFPGRSNNHMLLLMMELKGRFNSKIIKKAKFGDSYFDDMGGFNSVEKDRVLGTVNQLHFFFESSTATNASFVEGCREEGSSFKTCAGSAFTFDAPDIGENEG